MYMQKKHLYVQISSMYSLIYLSISTPCILPTETQHSEVLVHRRPKARRRKQQRKWSVLPSFWLSQCPSFSFLGFVDGVNPWKWKYTDTLEHKQNRCIHSCTVYERLLCTCIYYDILYRNVKIISHILSKDILKLCNTQTLYP